MMHHGKIIPSLNFHKDRANPAIEFDRISLRVSTSLTEWNPGIDGKRTACVNSFGFGGTNCHAILQQIPSRALLDPVDSCNLIVISGKSTVALRNTLDDLLNQIKSPEISLKAVSYTSLNKRTHHIYRLSLVARSIEDLQNVANVKSASISDLKPIQTEPIRLVFLFCGVGTVWKGMCQEMLKESKPFQRKFIEVSKELEFYTEFSLLETVQSPPETLEEDPYIGPLLIFATQVALFNVYSTLKIIPDMIIGQSVGEVAAAHAAGCLTLKDAVRLIYYRSHLSAKYSGGTMMVIGKCQLEDIKQLCQKYKTVCIAVYSSNSACVVSGDKTAIDELKTHLSQTKPEIMLKVLNVGCAYHSQHMDEACTEIEKKISAIAGNIPNIPIISTVTGQEIRDDEMGKAAYWTRNLRNPVLLRDAVLKALPANEKSLIVEIGPKPVVKAHLKNITDEDVVSVPSINSPNEIMVFFQALGFLYDTGVNVNWKNLFRQQHEPISIHRYKFNREGTLIAANSLKAGLRLEFDNSTAHPLVSPIPLTPDFRVTLNQDNALYIYEHQVQGRLIAPGALYGEIGLAVTKEVKGIPIHTIAMSLQFVRPLTITKNQPIELKVQLSGEMSFTVRRKTDILCKGRISEPQSVASKHIDIDKFTSRCTTVVTKTEFYEVLKSLGFAYGKTLSVINHCQASDREFIAELEFSETHFNAYSLHPVVLDGALQTIALAYLTSKVPEKPEKPIPVRIGQLRVHRQIDKKMMVVGRIREINKFGAIIDLFICNVHGDVSVEIMKYEVSDITKHPSGKNVDDSFYVTKWKLVDELSKKTGELPDSSVVVTFDTKAKLMIESATKVKHVVALPYDFDRVTPEEMVTVFLNFIRARFESYKEISEILFYTGLSYNLERTNPEEVFVASKSSCTVLMHIMQHFAKMKTFNIPFYVLTKQTQVKTGDFIGNPCYNVLGSELWGMARCVMRERIFSKIYIIDMEKDSDIKIVSDIMDHTRNQELEHIAEYKIEDGQFYYIQMLKFQHEGSTIRHNTYTDSETLQLRKSKENKTNQEWLVPKEESILSQDTLRMKVITGLSTSNWISPSLTDGLLETDVFESKTRGSSKMFFLETLGMVKYNDQRLKSINCFSSSRSDSQNFSETRECITCFPVVAANFVDVPQSCIVPKSLFPSYTPGNLLEVFVMFLIISKLDDNMPVRIFHDEVLKVNIELLDCILNYSKKKLINSCLIHELDSRQINGRFQVILFAKHINCVENVLATLSSTACKVVVYSLCDRTETKMISHRYQNLTLQFLNGDDVLCKETVARTMKKITTWSTNKKYQTVLKRCYPPSTHVNETNRCFAFQEDCGYTGVFEASNLKVQCSEKHLFRRHASYVIIGGLTGLGWEIALTIAKLGGGVILLLGRSKPNDNKQTEINHIGNRYKCIMEYFPADISKFKSIADTFTEIKSKFPNRPIKGVFNGAAVVNDALLPSMTEDKFDQVLRPKILGTWNLHLVTRDLELDYFVMHSSLTSIFGNPGQSNYGAGNSFKDATALYRRSLGLPGQTMNWGALKLGLVDEQLEKHLAEQGFLASDKDFIIKCFLRSLLIDSVQVIIAEVDWQTAMTVSSDMPLLFSKYEPVLVELNLLETMRLKVHDKIFVPTIGIDELRLQSVNERKGCILDIVQRISADTCAVELPLIKPTTTLASLGIDSMKAMAFINSVMKHVSCSIPVIAVLEEDATPVSIVDVILEQLCVEHGLAFNEHNEKNKDMTNTMSDVTAVYEEAKGKFCDIELCLKSGSDPTFLHWFNDSVDMKIRISEIRSVHRVHRDGQVVVSVEVEDGKKHVFKSSEVDKMETFLRYIDSRIEGPNGVAVSASTYL